ncbi:carbonic anhydrase 2 [Teleopsis dalmanni]|uniref:carbonic anhydrase 2 n=1 Tax=Teleopsis dalmanni TaxID=139649 RepID=UPI0018CFEA88|nr:carbonic anhydrase 2 [Teleopsis dalmanni]
MNLKVLLYTVFITIGITTASHWGYPDLDADEAFPMWGGLCDTGTHQSPIDLSQKGALKAEYDDLDFHNYNRAHTGVSVVNNGHSIQLSKFQYPMKLERGPLLEGYEVEQIHLHWWSEHTIDNVRYPMEAHIVHRNKRYPNMTMAANFKDGLAVIGVLYHVSNQENEAIDTVLEYLDEVKSYKNMNQEVHMKRPFVVRDLFPTVAGYLTYAGSLTTPSCAESVTWIVLLETFPVTMEQVEKFKQTECDGGRKLKNNYRIIQKSNNRPVLLVLNNRTGAAAPVGVSIGLVVLAALLARFLN